MGITYLLGNPLSALSKSINDDKFIEFLFIFVNN